MVSTQKLISVIVNTFGNENVGGKLIQLGPVSPLLQKLEYGGVPPHKIAVTSTESSSLHLDDKSKSADFEEWDSLGQLAIITSLDKKFKGKLNLNDISEADDLKKISTFLKKKKVLI